MLILAAIFKCLDPVLTIAASLSTKPLFFAPIEKRDEAIKYVMVVVVTPDTAITQLLTMKLRRARRQFVTGNSDLLTNAAAYSAYMALRHDSKSAQRQFCDDNFISPFTAHEITSLKHDLHSALASIGFVPLHSSSDAPKLNIHSSNENLVKAVICGGLWPRIVTVAMPRPIYDRVQSGTVERHREAKEFTVLEKDEQVFIHPQSIMFTSLGAQKSPFFVYFSKSMTSKVFLRDVTEVSLFKNRHRLEILV